MINKEQVLSMSYEQLNAAVRDAFQDAFTYYAIMDIKDAVEDSGCSTLEDELDGAIKLGNRLGNTMLSWDSFCLNEAQDYINDYLEDAGLV